MFLIRLKNKNLSSYVSLLSVECKIKNRQAAKLCLYAGVKDNSRYQKTYPSLFNFFPDHFSVAGSIFTDGTYFPLVFIHNNNKYSTFFAGYLRHLQSTIALFDVIIRIFSMQAVVVVCNYFFR